MRLREAEPTLGRAAARVAAPVKTTDPFYLSREWREHVDLIKQQRGYTCEEPTCRVDCRRTPRRLIGDHIVERSDGGADLDPLNTRLLCLPCHNRKTAAARGKRRVHG